MTIRVLIADDHPIVRSGVRNELARHDDLQVVGEALNGNDAIRMTNELKPDVLLLDIQMPGRRAIEVVQEVKERVSACRILVLSAHGDIPTIIGMLKSGVDGYILKDEDPASIAEAIRAVLSGETWLSPGVSDRLISILGSIGGVKNSNVLTKRELQVLQWLASGITTKEIATNLQIAERTVEFHITNILRKLGTKGRLEAAMKAREMGLL